MSPNALPNDSAHAIIRGASANQQRYKALAMQPCTGFDEAKICARTLSEAAETARLAGASSASQAHSMQSEQSQNKPSNISELGDTAPGEEGSSRVA